MISKSAKCRTCRKPLGRGVKATFCGKCGGPKAGIDPERVSPSVSEAGMTKIITEKENPDVTKGLRMEIERRSSAEEGKREERKKSKNEYDGLVFFYIKSLFYILVDPL